MNVNNSQHSKVSLLCIPHVFLDVTTDKISKAFRKQNLGEVQSICMISKISSKKEKYNTANISIRWFENPQSIAARTLLSQGSEIRVYYKGPWYWNVYNYELKKTFMPRERKLEEEKIDTLIAPTLDLRISERQKLNANAKEFKSITEIRKQMSDRVENERRCKNLMKGVLLSGTINYDTNKIMVSEIEINYEGMSPIPPPRPNLRRQLT